MEGTLSRSSRCSSGSTFSEAHPSPTRGRHLIAYLRRARLPKLVSPITTSSATFTNISSQCSQLWPMIEIENLLPTATGEPNELRPCRKHLSASTRLILLRCGKAPRPTTSSLVDRRPFRLHPLRTPPSPVEKGSLQARMASRAPTPGWTLDRRGLRPRKGQPLNQLPLSQRGAAYAPPLLQVASLPYYL